MDSSATESPLDVLSRAATMVQDNTFNTLPPSYDEARSYLKCKENASDGNKRSKGSCKIGRPAIGASVSTAAVTQNIIHHPEPIDMSIAKKLRGSPPSYQQSLQLIQFPTSVAEDAERPHRPSVITSCSANSNNSNNCSDVSDGDGVCDPVVDEHFRRSLGTTYLRVFSSNNNSKNNPTPNGVQRDIVTEETGSALSVDDHFAKALGGDVWLKLQFQHKETESKKKNKANNDSVSSPMDQVQDVSTSSMSAISIVDTKATTKVKSDGQKSLLRPDRRLL